MKTRNAVLAAALALGVAPAFAANTHTVTFRKMDGTVLQTIEVAHGANATSQKPALPTESGMTAQSWDCVEKLANVTNDVTCWALYEASTAKSPSTSIASQSVVDRATPYSLDEYFQIYNNLAWSDEFSGSSLSVGYGSGKNWNYDTEQRNNELQKYTSNGNNHIVSDGTLKLECRRESSGGKSFTSGSIKSNNKVQFKYGRCEIRAKLNKQKGTWPAFWTMGTGNWPACGELDVFEQINGSEWIGGNFHLPKGSATISNSALVCPEDGTHWGDAFHRIGFIWNEFEAVWYVDDHIFKRMDIRNTSRYSMLHDRYRYILLNLAFGGNWPGQTDPNDSSIANFTSEAFEIDYCRIFTNTTANRTITREAEPEGTKLTAPVNATVWRGWQMRWGKSGAYRSGLDRSEAAFCKAAMTEYFTRDNADIVTFLTRPAENTGASDLTMPFNVPGVTSLFLSPEQGSNNNSWEGDTREKLLSGVLFSKNRFSQSRSAISSLPLTNEANYTNCCAVVAELVEKDSGAKVKVVSVNLSQTNGTDYATLFNKLNQFKNERTILLFQSMDSAYHTPFKNQASSKLDKAYKYLGEYKVWPTYQFSYATTNCVSATATNPAPLSVPKSNGQASGTHTNQAYCATVQFDAEQEAVIEYGQLDKSAFSKKMDVTFSGYSGTALTDFPVLVKLSTAISGFSYGDFQKTNGGDLRFADSTGKLLPHEVDTWNPSGVSTVWVKVPSLSANAKITACYGCANPPDVAAKDVWDANYVGVWHLGGGSTTMKESTLVTSDLTASGDGMDLAATGIAGGAVDFKAYNTGRKLVAPDHNALDGFSACTLEAWTYQTSQNQNSGILSKRAGFNNSVSYQIYDGGSGSPSVGLTMGTNSTSGVSSGVGLYPELNKWNHLVYTFSIGTVTGYRNGTAGSSKSFPKSTVLAGTGNFCVGSFDANDARNFPGKIDEVRVSKTARSAAWIKATHDTIANVDFATYAVEGVTPVVRDPVLVVTVGAGVTNTLSAITNVTAATWITNVVKRGAGTLVASGMPSGYSKRITVEAGVWQGGASTGDFGASGTVIDVKDGASLAIGGANGSQPANNTLSGKTVNLYGAKNSAVLGKVHVYGTNTVALGENVSINLKNADSILYLGSSAWDAANIRSGAVNLGGKTLTIQSSWKQFQTGATFSNGGGVKLHNTALYVEGQVPAFSGSGTLESDSAVNLKKKINAPGWTLKSSSGTYGNIQRMPTETDYPGWEGPAQFSGASAKLATYAGSSASISNTVFNLKGAVSGSGTLSVGPGWLNLHSANNTYSGAVFVNGRAVGDKATILPGSGGIGLWNGAACFPNASSITFTNTARLAFMDATACTVPNAKFIALAGETQSVSGGVNVARSTMAGFVKEGAGTLCLDASVDVTGLGNVKAGTLKVANRINLDDPTDQAAVLASTTVFSNLQFAAGTKLDLCDAPLFMLNDFSGAPSITNVGIAAVTGKWTLTNPNQVMNVYGDGIELFGGNVSGGLAFMEGATFDLADEAAFTAAAASAGDRGILVAYARWVIIDEFAGIPAPMPQPSANISPRWQMYVDPSNVRELRLRLAPASGYAAWVAEKGISGSPDEKYNGIERGVRYAFDIDPETADIGAPVIQVVRDASGNPCVEARELAAGRTDVTFGVLATESLSDWGSAVLIPMKKFSSDSLWKPSASEDTGYVFPAQMFFKYTIDIQ